MHCIIPNSTTHIHTYTWLWDFWWQLIRPVSQADVNMAGNAKPFKAISSLESKQRRNKLLQLPAL